MARVLLHDVRKSYTDMQVIHGVSMDVADGEFVVIVGPSGCGKSTLLRMVAGLETISSGEIAIGERVVNELEPKDRDIAMVFQNYALYPHMSVYDNMAYGLRIRNLSKSDIDVRVKRAAGILELEALLGRRPRQLSGGQRQRVAMGRAIVREPAVFLFRQFFLTIPEELAEASRIDGAGPMRFFFDVVLPLSKTSMAALFVIQFIYGWNQYLWPLLVTTNESMYTVVIGIKRMILGGDALTEWNVVMATAMLALLPPAAVVVLMQKWFVKGLVETEK